MTDWDFAVIGSGFGGSVSALRLVEKGYRVVLLEQGVRVGREEMLAARRDLKSLLHIPALGAHGFFSQRVLRHLCVVGGVGLGGGSLVYGAVLLRPRPSLFSKPGWRSSGVAWASELAPHFETAERMLGAADSRWHGPQDEALRQTAKALGAEDTFGPVRLGIHQGESGVVTDDPYFNGRGPRRTGCRMCGECMIVGCAHDAKNSLDKNYLHLAERDGLEILTGHKATFLADRGADGFEIRCQDSRTKEKLAPVRARRVVVACGVLGTVELLLRSRAEGGLPNLSPRTGDRVRTNSEAIVAIVADDEAASLAQGPAVSTHFFLRDGTHVTQNRFATGQDFMRFQLGPMVDGATPKARALAALRKIARRPAELTRLWRAPNWHGRFTMLAIMQDAENELALRYRPGFFGGLRTEVSPASAAQRAPATMTEANRAARIFADSIGGRALTSIFELADMSVTAHILGGCVVGPTSETSVIDADHRLHGHPGVLVVDASAIPGNVGVNPSLTIAAVSERAMSRVPRAPARLAEPAR